jgi:hypothetical protein
MVLAFVGFACRNPPVDSADEPTTMRPESTDPCTWGEGGEAIARTMDGVDGDGDGVGEAALVMDLPQVRLEAGNAGFRRTFDIDDFSGDGIPDVATWSIVTPELDGVDVAGLAVHLYDGPLNGSMCDVLYGQGTLIDPEGYFVQIVQSAGDFYGDGVSDLLVSTEIGTLVVRGPLQPDSVSDGGSQSVVWETVDGQSELSAPLGDVNGDGLADIAVGSISWENPGAVYVIFGPAETDFAERSPAWVEPDASVLFGYNVSGVGDMSGDGLPDIAAGVSGGVWGEGYPTYVFTSVPDAPTHPADDGIVIVSRYGEGDGAEYYEDAGDVNGDGYGDMAMPGVGSTGITVFFGPLRDDGTPIAWEDAGAWLWFGNPMTVEGRGDVDGDGFDDLAVASLHGSLVSCPEGSYDPDCQPGLVHLVAGPQVGVVEPVDMIQGYGAWGYFGSTMNGGADMDGDGQKDLVVAGDGWVYVLFGV